MAELTMDALRALANGNLGEAREQMDMEVKLEAAAEEAALSFFFTNIGEEGWPENPMEYLKNHSADSASELCDYQDDGTAIGMDVDQEHENWDAASILESVEKMKTSFLREMHYAAELSSQHKQPNVQQRDDSPIQIPTANGALVIEQSTDPMYPGMYVDFLPQGLENSVQIALIEDIPKESETPESKAGSVSVRIWGDPLHSDDYTQKTEIPVEDCREYCSAIQGEEPKHNRMAESQEDISLREKMEKEAEELAFSQVFCNTYEDTWPEDPFAYLDAADEQGVSLGSDLDLIYVEDGKTMQPSERYEDIAPSVIADIVIDTKEHILAGMEFTHKLATSDRNAEIEKLRKENEMLRKENKKLSKGKGR